VSQHPFEYVKPNEDQVSRMKAINVHFKAAYDELLATAPDSSSHEYAIQALQEARMWANAAILGIDAIEYAENHRR
jgi:hypothetical protein